GSGLRADPGQGLGRGRASLEGASFWRQEAAVGGLIGDVRESRYFTPDPPALEDPDPLWTRGELGGFRLSSADRVVGRADDRRTAGDDRGHGARLGGIAAHVRVGLR